MIQPCHKCGAVFTASSAESAAENQAHIDACAGSREYRLRQALGDLIGAHTKEELGAMLIQLHEMKHLAPDELSFNVSVQAIEVMLETAP